MPQNQLKLILHGSVCWAELVDATFEAEYVGSSKRKPRKKSSSMSEASRRSLRKYLKCCEFAVESTYTITLSLCHYASVREFNRFRYCFTKRLQRDFHGCGGVFCYEFTKCGKPHIHMVFANRSAIDGEEVAKTVKSHWRAVMEKNLVAGACFIELAKSIETATNYLAKNVQKTMPEEFTMDGRWWGHFGPVKVSPIAAQIPTEVIPELRLLLSQLAEDQGSGEGFVHALQYNTKNPSLWLTEENREILLDYLRGKELDDFKAS